MAGEFEHIKGKGNRFTSDNQPTNRGRKPKLYTIAKKSYGITLDEFKEVVNYLWQLPKEEVKEIAEKDDTPIWMANVCRSLYKDTKSNHVQQKKLTIMVKPSGGVRGGEGTREEEIVQAPVKQRKDILRRCVKISSVWNRITGIIKMKPYMCMALPETS